MMHKVKMLTTQKGVHDGEIYPVEFIEGGEYEIGPDLLNAFVSMGAVDLADGETLDDGDALDEEFEEKSEGDAPENKSLGSAPENKKKKR